MLVNTVLDEKYAEYFGFTSQEVKEMAKYYGREDKLSEISEWYDGYLFGRTEIYNPWSVINYFNNDCIPRAFWSRTSSNDMILDIIKEGNPEIQNALMDLLQDMPVQAFIDTNVIYPEIKANENIIFSFLLMTGYLKLSETVMIENDDYICNLLIPNKEIKGVFKKQIIDNLANNKSYSAARKFQLALKTHNKDALQRMLREYLLQSASCFDTAQENFYHGMMLGLLAIVADDYLINSNREVGEGRFDIELKPLSNINPGILMEFKALNDADEDELDKKADEAIEQIIDKQYASELKGSGITNIWLYGIAFSKKKATVKTIQLR